MAITLVRGLEMMSRPSGLFVSSAATSNGTTTTLVDTSIVRYDTKVLANKWLYMVSATNTDINNTSRRISGVSSSTITTATAFASATTSGDTYFILPYDPDLFRDALQQAARTLGDLLWLPVRDETLVVDQLIGANASFETAVAAGDSPGWTRVSTPTLTDETTIRLHGTNSLKFVATGLDQIYQGIDGNLNLIGLVGKPVVYEAGVFADQPSKVRIGLSFDAGTSFSYSDFHKGRDEWESLSVTASVPKDWTSVRVYCSATDTTCYFDHTRAYVDPITKYTIPATTPYPGPNRLFIQRDVEFPNGEYDPYPSGGDIRGKILRMESMGPLTPPTTTASIELSEARGELLIAQAIVYLHRSLTIVDSGNSKLHEQQMAMWDVEATRLKNNPRVRMRAMGAHERFGWNTMEDGETRFLELQR